MKKRRTYPEEDMIVAATLTKLQTLDGEAYIATVLQAAGLVREAVKVLSSKMSTVSGFLNADERDLLVNLWVTVMNSRARSVDNLRALVAKNPLPVPFDMWKRYKENIEADFDTEVEEILVKMDELLLVNVQSSDSTIYYLMKEAKINGIIFNVKDGDERELALSRAHRALKLAENIGIKDVEASDILRRQLEGILSVFYQENPQLMDSLSSCHAENQDMDSLSSFSTENQVNKDVRVHCSKQAEVRIIAKELKVMLEACTRRLQEAYLLTEQMHPTEVQSASSSNPSSVAERRDYLRTVFLNREVLCVNCYWRSNVLSTIPQYRLEGHNKKNHPELRVVCTKCTNWFRDNEELLDHESLCHDGQPCKFG